MRITSKITLTSKIILGTTPNYQLVLTPKMYLNDKIVVRTRKKRLIVRPKTILNDNILIIKTKHVNPGTYVKTSDALVGPSILTDRIIPTGTL